MSKPEYGENRLTELKTIKKPGQEFHPKKETVDKCCYRRLIYKRSKLGLWPLSIFIMWLLMEVDGLNDFTYPSEAKLALWCGVSKRKIRVALKQLKDQGFIDINEGGGRGNSNQYFILWHLIYEIPFSEIKGVVGLPISKNKRGPKRPPLEDRKEALTEAERRPLIGGKEALNDDKGGPNFLASTGNDSGNGLESSKELLKVNKELAKPEIPKPEIPSLPSTEQPGKPEGGKPPSKPPFGICEICNTPLKEFKNRETGELFSGCPNWKRSDHKQKKQEVPNHIQVIKNECVTEEWLDDLAKVERRDKQ